MNKIIVIFMIGIIAPYSTLAMSNNQNQIYKSWVLSRCLSYVIDDKKQKQDALNTASAFLEESTLPVESFLKSEALIQQFVSLEYQGSIRGTFNIKKCIDLFNSNELEHLYGEVAK